jgi:CheY-like chemotaxis protein
MKPDCTFLIIDDNEIDQLVTQQLLKKDLGATHVVQAGNGIEAMQWLKEMKSTFPESLVIILDVRMPLMDGFQFLEAFESLHQDLQKTTKIIMLSSTLDPRDIEQAEAHKNVMRLFSKPLPVKELEGLI